MSSKDHPLDQLLKVMARLRDPEQGCPWDLRQDYASILPHTLEEAYEVADAIERGDFDQLRDELGDLLFQVVFYARMAEEENRFDFSEIVEILVEKLVRRHPHVNFSDAAPSGVAISESEVLENWERIKQQERGQKSAEPSAASVLDDIPMAIPALARARKLQRRAASTRFDWPEASGVMAKITEELEEVRELVDADTAPDPQALEDELGDLMFSCVNLSRHLKVDPEAALRRANRKFEDRFRALERLREAQAARDGESESEFLNRLWEQVKASEIR